MKILITAGPTREYLDPVRFLSNRSTGKMGYALAEEAVSRGHGVLLISGPVSCQAPEAVAVKPVVSASEMESAVLAGLPDADVLIMCAAVADWRPREEALQKLKKDQMSGVLELERTPDILESVKPVRRAGQRVIGFAAETEDVCASALAKCRRKSLDMIVANDVSRADAGFESDDNAVWLITPDGASEEVDLMAKSGIAKRIMDWLER